MSIRVIVNGAQGKMGLVASEAIRQHPDFELVGQLTRQDDLKEAIALKRADVVLDLTRADVVYANALTIIESGAHPVIGTSGLKPDEIAALQSLCEQKNLGGIIAPNFSISVILMMRFAAQAAAYLPEVEIVETHTPQKYDAPSSTAIKTAEMIAAARKQLPPESPFRESIAGVRGGKCQGIPIHALRLPGLVARQSVIFASTGETLTITHDSVDRASFMPGVILCCQKVMGLQTLYYGMENLLV